MEELLRKIDEVVKRTNCTYEDAKLALDESKGDVLEAVIYIEKNKKCCNNDSELKKKGEEILSEIKKIIEMGNVTKLTIKKNNEIILNIPITAGAVGVIVAPFLSLAGLTAALLTECKIEITKDSGEVIYVNDEINKSVNHVKDEFNNFKNSL